MADIADDYFVALGVWPRVLQAMGAEAFGQFLPTLCGILANVEAIEIVSNKDSEETPQCELVALNAHKMENRMTELHVVDTLLEAYEESGRMVSFVGKLFAVLLGCLVTPNSHELRSDAVTHLHPVGSALWLWL